MISGLMSMYSSSFPAVLVYMLQSTEYQPAAYLKWFWRTSDYSKVMQRRQLQRTTPARLLLLVLRIGMSLELAAGAVLIAWWVKYGTIGFWQYGLSLIIIYPVLWAHLLVVPIFLGRVFIVGPKNRRLIQRSKDIFSNHPGIKIAVAGSYGKTTMKELLGTVLSEGRQVAITPANKNVAYSHAAFAATLSGGEDILVIEYGEGAPGDVARFAATTRPTHAIITGLAPAHLDHYPTLQAAGEDIFAVADYLDGKNVYVNDESPAIKPFLRPAYKTYNHSQALGWKISQIKVGYDGTRFVMKKGQNTLKLHSALLGRHQVGPLALVAALSHELGLTKEQIEKGIGKTVPFEHRLQPRPMHGAWIVDDTYNGNIDGIRAGLRLLSELPAKRTMYVTPGLVDQGVETEAVHHEMGTLIAAANPDIVVLMKNSACPLIVQGLKDAGYKGDLRIEDKPLEFYTNIDQFLAAGDLVVMQNDWTDNYN